VVDLTTDVERMSAEELQSLDLGRLGYALNELASALAQCGRDAIDARRRMASVRIAWSRRDPAVPSREEYTALLEAARSDFDSIAIRARGLRDLKSTIQTIVRAIP
jgi:hypothetical protein